MLAPSSLCLSGSCTIADVPVQRDRIAAALMAGDGPLLLDLSNLAPADVAFVQLLVATRAEANRRKRAFAVAAWSSETEDALTRAGLIPADFASLPALGA